MARWVLDRTASFSLVDDATRKLWNELTDSTLQSEEFWPAYREHVKLRNNVVHRGERVDRDAANLSLAATSALFDHIEIAVQRAAAKWAEPTEATE